MSSKLKDDDLNKVSGGYGNSQLCLPTGINIEYRVWTSSTDWERHNGIIMSVEEKEGTYIYDIFRNMSSIHDYVKAEDIYQLKV